MMGSIIKNIVVVWFLLACILAPVSKGQGHSTFIQLNWTGGEASCTDVDCNTTLGETFAPYFACNDGRGDWNGGQATFMDPIPPDHGYVLLAIEATLFGRFDCNGTEYGDLYVDIFIEGIIYTLSPSLSFTLPSQSSYLPLSLTQSHPMPI